MNLGLLVTVMKLTLCYSIYTAILLANLIAGHGEVGIKAVLRSDKQK